MTRRFLTLLLLSAVPATVARAASVDQTKATNLNYDVDAAFTYVDALKRPQSDAIAPLEAAPAPAAAEGPRALGLKRLRFAATWQSVDSASLSLVLRPDAMNRQAEAAAGAPARELDTRAGDPYRPMPTVRLLDAYALTVKPASALSGAFGVFEELQPSPRVYAETLGFGLGVRFPAKFSGVRLAWKKDVGAVPAPGTAPPMGFGVDLQLFQGDEDRAETLSAQDDDSHDSAPVAADPYQGSAVRLNFRAAATDLALLAGTYDAKEGDARKSEVFGRVSATLGVPVGARAAKLALDLRYAKERWRGDGVDVEPRAQQSVELSSSVPVTPTVWWLFGAGYGKSDADPTRYGVAATEKLPVKGWLVETGALSTVGKGVTVQLLLQHEKREMKDAAGDEVGAFRDGDGDDHPTVRRMGLELDYQLNDNA